MPNLAQLKKQAEALGLAVQKSGNRPAKEPYIRALRAHYLAKDHPAGLPYEELIPMLCFDFWELSEREQNAIWSDKHDWVAQRKVNGCRVILHFRKDVGIFAHTREINLAQFRRTEITDRLLFSSHKPTFSATIDGELFCDKLLDTRLYCKKGTVCKSLFHSTTALLSMKTEEALRAQKGWGSILKVYAFDIVAWDGTDLRPKKLCERLAYLADFQETTRQTDLDKYFEFPTNCFLNKREFYERITAEGGEGVVLKNLNSAYQDSTSRSRHGWAKAKRQLQLEAYVSGFDRGRPGSQYENKIASLTFSVQTTAGNHAIARVSNLPWAYRKSISGYDPTTNTVSLRADVYGQVATLCGLELSQRAFRLVHPKIEFWRQDLKQGHCVYKMEDLQAIRQGVTDVLPIRVADYQNGEEQSGV